MLNGKSNQRGNILVMGLVAFIALTFGVLVTYLYMNKSKVIPSTPINTLEPTTSEQSNTADWKTYPDASTSGLPYSFKYPSGVQVTLVQDMAVFKSNKSLLTHFFVKTKDISALMGNYQVFGSPKITFSSKAPVTYVSLSGYKAKTDNGNDVFYFLGNDTLNGVLIFNHTSSDKTAEDLFNSVIKTVEFN